MPLAGAFEIAKLGRPLDHHLALSRSEFSGERFEIAFVTDGGTGRLILRGNETRSCGQSR
jgi:hypothetical protein